MAKPAKRAYGEGGIRQMEDGRWEARIRITDPMTGERKPKTFSRKTKKEVVEWLNDIKAKIHTGQYIAARNITVGQWLNTWLNEYVKHKVRPTTWESYESIIRVHVTPVIGHIQLQELRPEQLQKLYNDKLRSGNMKKQGGLSATTVRYISAAIQQALKQAVKNGWIMHNVAEWTEKPQSKKKEIQPLTLEQVNLFLTAAKDNPLYEAFLLEGVTGLRRGELLGLRWQDIDMEQNRLTVNQAVILTNQGLLFSEPKTKASRRTIPLPDAVMATLKTHRKRQIETQMQAGVRNEHDLLFCNPRGGIVDPLQLVRQFEKVLSLAGLPRIRFHDMRHTHATLLLAQGEHVKVVQERLGHTTVRMTLDTYSHLLPGMQEQATETIRRIINL